MVIYSNEIKIFLDKIYFYELTHRNDLEFSLYQHYERELYNVDKFTRHTPSSTFPMSRDGLFGFIVGRLEFGYSFDGVNACVEYYVNREPQNDWFDWLIKESKQSVSTRKSFRQTKIINECVHKILKKYLRSNLINEQVSIKSHNKAKRPIRLNEGDIRDIVKSSVTRYLLTENRESKSRGQTEKVIVQLFQNTFGDRLFQTATDDQGQPILTQRGDEQSVVQYLERQIRTTFFHNDWANIKFEAGIARIAYGELGMQANEDQQSLQKLSGILKIISQAHSDEFDYNLNGMLFSDLNNKFGQEVSNMGKEEQDRLNNAEYNGNGGYTIVKIDSFEDAQRFYKYTNPDSPWCITHMQNMFDTYGKNGQNTIYFAYKKGFENMKPIVGEGCPLDEYGLSLLSIIMAPDYGDGGSLAYCTCRWNHDNGGSDSVMNAQQLSKVLGGSVFKLCPPRKFEIRINGDLGLPSGTIWMTKNVGASSPSDYGKYFAWGMKQGFYANEIGGVMFTRGWHKEQQLFDWREFTFDDHSHAPSAEQCKELIANCKYDFITYGGTNGGLFTSKINGNSIFIPAAGYYGHGVCDREGEWGYTWLDSFNGSNFAYTLGIGRNAVGIDTRLLYTARNVRGVLA